MEFPQRMGRVLVDGDPVTDWTTIGHATGVANALHRLEKQEMIRFKLTEPARIVELDWKKVRLTFVEDGDQLLPKCGVCDGTDFQIEGSCVACTTVTGWVPGDKPKVVSIGSTDYGDWDEELIRCISCWASFPIPEGGVDWC